MQDVSRDDSDDVLFIDDSEFDEEIVPDPDARNKAMKLLGYTDEMMRKLLDTGEITITPEIQKMRDAPAIVENSVK